MMYRRRSDELGVLAQFSKGLNPELVNSILDSNIWDKPGMQFLRSDNDSINKAEFVILCLIMMDKVRTRDIYQVSKTFDYLTTVVKGRISNADGHVSPSRNSDLSQMSMGSVLFNPYDPDFDQEWWKRGDPSIAISQSSTALNAVLRNSEVEDLRMSQRSVKSSAHDKLDQL